MKKLRIVERKAQHNKMLISHCLPAVRALGRNLEHTTESLQKGVASRDPN